jgi:mannose-1-phosphate guanylyltransferase
LIANNFGYKLSELSKDAFLLFPKISIDFAIMEKSKDILCLPTDFGWSDVGSFDSLWNYHLSKGALKNKDDFKISYLNSSNNFIIVNSSLKINLIDINDLIIVENNGEILIMKKNSSQKIKDLIKIKK